MKPLITALLLLAACSTFADSTLQPIVMPDGRTIVCSDYGTGVIYCS